MRPYGILSAGAWGLPPPHPAGSSGRLPAGCHAPTLAAGMGSFRAYASVAVQVTHADACCREKAAPKRAWLQRPHQAKEYCHGQGSHPKQQGTKEAEDGKKGRIGFHAAAADSRAASIKTGTGKMNKEGFLGSGRQILGTAKAAMGKFWGNTKMEAEGRAQQAEGKAEQAEGRLQEAAGHTKDPTNT